MIRVCNVTKRFGNQLVLDNVSLDIPDGKTTAIVGPSGVGKSVLLKLIVGMIKPDFGQIWIGDKEITAVNREVDLNKIRADLGVLFQNAALFDSLTVYENVAFPLRQRNKRNSRIEIHKKVVSMLEELSLEAFAYCLPGELSMGMRKRVGMARALVTLPKVILFDEPNTGLDPWDGQEVYNLIKKIRTDFGFTGIVISHEIPEVFQVADQVIMLLKGQIAEEGTPEAMQCSTNPAVQQFLTGSIDGPIKIQ